MIRTKVLMKHQLLTLKFCSKILKEFGIWYSGIFSDYGTGKTLTFLCLCHIFKFKKILVVSSKTSVQYTWPREIKKHTDYNWVFLLSGTNGIKDRLRALELGLRRCGSLTHGYGDTSVFLINFDGIKNEVMARALVNAKFDVMCIDESTKIKDPRTERSKWAWAIGSKIKYRCILTGFPATEGIHELYSQSKFLDGGKALGASYWGFLNKLFVKYGTKLFPHKNSVVWITKQLKPFCIRITNEELDMPPVVYDDKRVPKTEKQKKLLEQLDKYYSVDYGNIAWETAYILPLIMKELQICDGFIYDKDCKEDCLPTCTKHQIVETVDTNKDELLVNTLEDIDVRKNKVVVWAYFGFTLLKLNKLLTKLGYCPSLITGNTKDIGRVVDEFKYSTTSNVLLASLKKASESITLTEKNHICKYAIYYGNYWSNDIRGNSEARMGKERASMAGYGKDSYTITYTDLLVEGTREVDVYNALRGKKKLINVLKEEFKLKMGGRM